MIIPSIDLINGHAVQLVGGKVEQLKVDAGDPVPIAKQFRLVHNLNWIITHYRVAGEIAIVDLDAALSKGNNNLTIENIMKECAVSNCIVRVGGGIRDVQSALNWLNKGAHKGNTLQSLILTFWNSCIRNSSNSRNTLSVTQE